MFRKSYILISLFCIFHLAFGTTPIVKKDKQPKRIIRMCCAFGTNIKVFGLPFLTLNKIVNIHSLGNHQYLTGKTENNGIIYTKKAGFIDIAHVRDQADWTAYLYHKLSNMPKGITQKLHLGQELGHKVVTINIPLKTTQIDLVNMAGHIAYELSNWHEIASWFGATKAPILNEKFSSFSFEDNFSNALGVFLGKQALLSTRNYNVAMDSLLHGYLQQAEAAQDNLTTENTMLNLAQKYWNPQKSIPNKKLLIERNFNCSHTCSPIVFNAEHLPSIQFTQYTSNQIHFDEILTLTFQAGYRFPLKKVFPDRDNRIINTQDFESIITYIKLQVSKIN